MEQWWNDTFSVKPKYLVNNLSQCRSVRHNSHMHWPTIELGSPQSPATNSMGYGVAGGKIVMNDGCGIIWFELTVACLTVLSPHLRAEVTNP